MIDISDKVKQAYLSDGILKEYKIHFTKESYLYDDITNENIVQGSVSFHESLCSRDEIKFGLCEASVFECEVVGIGNIKGKEVNISITISEPSDFQIPDRIIYLGKFYVDSCTKQADMSHRRLVCYTKEPKWGSALKGIELLKQSLVVQNQDDYKIDAYNYCVSNGIIPGNTLYQESYTDISGSETTLTSYQMMMNCSNILHPRWYITANVTKTKYTIDNTNNLYLFERRLTGGSVGGHPQYNYQYILSEIKKAFKNYDSSKTWSFDTSTYMNYQGMWGLSNTYNGKTDLLYFTEKAGNKTGLINYILGCDEGYGPVAEFHDHIYPYVNRTDSAAKPYIETMEVIRCHVRSIPSSSSITSLEFDFDITMDTVTIKKVIDNHTVVLTSFPRNAVSKEISGTTVTGYNMSNSEIPARSIIEAYLEFEGFIGKYGRSGQFELVDLGNRYNLYPAETLYPSESLYPQGTDGYSIPSTYTSAWFDDDLSKPYGRVCCTYKYLDSSSKEAEAWAYYDLVDDYNSDDYQEYSLTDNYLIENNYFTFAQISALLQKIGNMIANVRYMKCNIYAVGQPWLESGDTIAVETTDGDIIKTVILTRTMSGEQRLQDNFVSY